MDRSGQVLDGRIRMSGCRFVQLIEAEHRQISPGSSVPSVRLSYDQDRPVIGQAPSDAADAQLGGVEFKATMRRNARRSHANTPVLLVSLW